jgi:hypothetical protein
MTHIDGIYRDHKPSSGTWPPEKVQRLIALVNEGKSGHEIAAALGMSRPACIGKASRLGFNIRRGERRSTGKRKHVATGRPHNWHKKRAPHLVIDNTAPNTNPDLSKRVPRMSVELPPSRNLLIGEVTRETCAYPTSTERANTHSGVLHRCCGNPVEEGRSYCRGHLSIVFVPKSEQGIKSLELKEIAA